MADAIQATRTPTHGQNFFDRLLSGRLWWALVAAILVLQSTLVLRHEPWLDEWQALQIALQSPDFAGMLENLRYEGHPPLWYLLLKCAALIVPAGAVLATVELPIALATQLIILLRAPFTRIERVLLSTSFFVLFDYLTLSRSLSLGVLLALLAFAFRRNRASWFALAQLPMADFLFGVLSIGLIVLAWKERRLWWPGLGLWLILGLLSAWTVRPAPEMIPALKLEGPAMDAMIYLVRLGALLLPLHIGAGNLVWNNPPPVMIALPCAVGWLVMAWRLLKRDSLSAILFFGFTAITLLFSVTVYPLAIRHLSLAVLLLVLLLWRLRETDSARPGLFLGWLAVASACGLLVAGLNLVKPFDTARQAARYIEDHGLADRHWVTFPDSRAQGVSALLGLEFERVERACTQSFIRWNYRSRIETLGDMEEEMAKIAARQGSFHLLTDFRIDAKRLKRAGDYRLLTYVPAGYDGQDYFLYQVRPDLPERAERPPQCAPRRLPLRILPR